MCSNPMQIQSAKSRSHDRKNRTVPCGSCAACRTATLRGWLFRLGKELERSSNPLFVTLTYDEQHVPYAHLGYDYDKGTAYLYGRTLKKRDVQLFMKSLRKEHSNYSNEKLKYFAVGEYGTRTGRPHYHIVLLNLHSSHLIHRCWKRGHTLSLPLKAGGIQYVMKYVTKDPAKPSKWHVQKEFRLTSKGIGENYLTEAVRKYHLEDITRSYITLKGGARIPIPKYFKEKLYTPEARHQLSLHLESEATRKKAEKILAHSQKYAISLAEAETILELRQQGKKHKKRLSETL